MAKVVKTGAGSEIYVHDANNNVIEETINDVTTTYNYDRNRLLALASGGVVGTYNYDPFGRLNTVTVAGRVIERNKHDGFDRIIAKQTQGATGGLSSTHYTYDPLDRTSTKTTGAGGDSEKTTTSLYLGLSAEILTEETAGGITKSFDRLADTEIIVAAAKQGSLPPPASASAVAEAEQKIGHRLPVLLRRLYFETANGGFGSEGGIGRPLMRGMTAQPTRAGRLFITWMPAR
ncbi:hypothetical protein [Actinomadura geliboluensis]|uniref:hypothetical protein n=1 Tax=Actinomadura geliboluensis TaxID=882440 RepID=UPI00371A4ACA